MRRGVDALGPSAADGCKLYAMPPARVDVAVIHVPYGQPTEPQLASAQNDISICPGAYCQIWA